MTSNIRSAIFKKVVKSVRGKQNVDIQNVMSSVSLKSHKLSNSYCFVLPLTTRTYNIEEKGDDILQGDLGIFDNIARQEDAIHFVVSREKYIKEVLESNRHSIAPPPISNKENIIVEFSSPNIAKPFHLGHLRSTIIGNYIANINSFLKHNVRKINYLGDWGTQFGLNQLGLERANITDEEIKNDPITVLHNAYVNANKLAATDPSVAEQAKEIFRQLETGESAIHKRWETFRNYTVEHLRKTYSRLGIVFDDYHWESMYRANNIKEIIETMEQMQLITVDNQNKKVISINEKRSVPILKSDGTTLYLTRDIGAAIDRFEKHKFDRMLYVVDNSQCQHFVDLIEILRKMEFPWTDKIRHIRFGRIIGMSSRKGTAILLDDILNEIRDVMKEKQAQASTTKVSLALRDISADILGISAVIINDLKQKRRKDYTFDWNAAFSAKGDTGVALQYAHCRLTSLEANSGAVLPSTCDPSVLKDETINDLIIEIGKFDEAVLKSYEELEPCILTIYLFRLTHTINKALNKLQVKGEPPHVANQRLLLFHVAKNILGQGMKLLGILPLDKM